MKRSCRRKPHKDPVTSELRQAILERDQACVLSKLDPSHQCRDQWGTPHRSDDLGRLSLEHVKGESRMGLRAPSDLGHLVAMCMSGNLAVQSKVVRNQIRAYLAEVNRRPTRADIEAMVTYGDIDD